MVGAFGTNGGGGPLDVAVTAAAAGDTTAPSQPALTLTEDEPDAHVVGTTIF